MSYKYLIILIVILILLMSSNCFCGTTFDDFAYAIRMVETGGQPNNGENAVGDHNKAIGPLQIHYEYYKDANIGGHYKDCNYLDFSIKVMKAYLNKYDKSAMEAHDWKRLSSIHHLGPKGLKVIDEVYWHKVERYMK